MLVAEQSRETSPTPTLRLLVSKLGTLGRIVLGNSQVALRPLVLNIY